MPMVHVSYSTSLPRELIAALYRRLPQAIAAALTCSDKDGDLTATDIELHFHPKGVDDIMPYPITVDVEATHFPSRDANLESRSAALGDAIVEILGDLEFGIWVKLFRACWVERKHRALRV